MTAAQYYATGRRKTSTARVFLRPGSGAIKVNHREFEAFFPREALRMQIRTPLVLTETADKFDVLATVAGGGVSGRGKRAILWVGLGGEVDSLRTLVTATRQELRRARLPYDARPFRPHLTISRVGDRVDPELLAKDGQTLHGYEGPQWTIDSMLLVASELGPRPVYTTLHRTGADSAS